MSTTSSNVCLICREPDKGAINYLLTCCECKVRWHHHCLRPPMPDEELTSLVRASIKAKPGKGLKFWKCRTCLKGKKKREEPILVSSDEEVQAIEPPRKAHKASTASKSIGSNPPRLVSQQSTTDLTNAVAALDMSPEPSSVESTQRTERDQIASVPPVTGMAPWAMPGYKPSAPSMAYKTTVVVTDSGGRVTNASGPQPTVTNPAVASSSSSGGIRAFTDSGGRLNNDRSTPWVDAPPKSLIPGAAPEHSTESNHGRIDANSGDQSPRNIPENDALMDVDLPEPQTSLSAPYVPPDFSSMKVMLQNLNASGKLFEPPLIGTTIPTSSRQQYTRPPEEMLLTPTSLPSPGRADDDISLEPLVLEEERDTPEKISSSPSSNNLLYDYGKFRMIETSIPTLDTGKPRKPRAQKLRKYRHLDSHRQPLVMVADEFFAARSVRPDPRLTERQPSDHRRSIEGPFAEYSR